MHRRRSPLRNASDAPGAAGIRWFCGFIRWSAAPPITTLHQWEGASHEPEWLTSGREYATCQWAVRTTCKTLWLWA